MIKIEFSLYSYLAKDLNRKVDIVNFTKKKNILF